MNYSSLYLHGWHSKSELQIQKYVVNLLNNVKIHIIEFPPDLLSTQIHDKGLWDTILLLKNPTPEKPQAHK